MICPRCDGEGYLTLWGTPRYDVTCGECGGNGEVRLPFLPPGTPDDPTPGEVERDG